jgi:hypothetical protein
MSAAASASLESSTRDILVAWERTREQWRDAKAAQFGHQFIEPLPDLAFQARDAMNHLEALLRKIKHDCE